MKILNRFIEWVLYTSVFAGFCSVGLCMATERLLIDHVPSVFNALHTLVFGSTLWVYNTHSLIKKSSPQVSDRFGWSLHYRYWHYIFFVAGLLMCIGSLFFLSYKILIGCAVLGVLSFAYSLPLLPFPDKKRLKDFGWIKILVLTGVWTIVTTILPILFWDEKIINYPYEVLLRFIFMFTLCVAFDIRDMETDLEANIFTLPNLVGLKNSYRIMNGTLILFAVLSIIQYVRYPSVTRLVGELISAVVTKWAIEYCRRHPSDKAYLGLVDGMMLLYALLVLFH